MGKNQRNTIFGIDLGTTYSCISYTDEHGKATIIPNKDHHLTTPSVVLFERDQRIVGEEAKNSALLNPDTVVEMVKRHMGEANWCFPYEDKEYSPEEISSYILRKLANDASDVLGMPVTDVVITCPAYFGIAQREATTRAGEIAGLNVHEVINEPTAAAITYGLQSEQDQVVLVYDLGGGTFDVTIIAIENGAITVVATGGDHNLGGRNWDEALVLYLAQQWQTATGSADDPIENPETLQDLWLKAERAKHSLSTRRNTKVVVTHAGQSIKVSIGREKFDELTAGLIDRTVIFTKLALKEARDKEYQHIDQVLLVGGSTKMPQVSERLQKDFSFPIRLFEPDEAVAKGAALYGQKLALTQQQVDKKPKRPEIRREEQTVAPADLPFMENPFEEEEEDQYSYAQPFEDEPQRASVGNRALERLFNTKITNVTSHSFGIVVTIDPSTPRSREVVENLMIANDPLPCFRTRTFGTLEANQEKVELRIVENTQKTEFVEQEYYTPEAEIGKVILPLPPKLPANSPIEVTFELDQQGRLFVVGKEPNSNTIVDATFETHGVMSRSEVAEARSRATGITIL